MAKALRDWLPRLVEVQPWLSETKPGRVWEPELFEALEASHCGIFCITAENSGEPWLLFEAGALVQRPRSHAFPYLVDSDPAHVPEPLRRFNYTFATKEKTLAMVREINLLVKQADGNVVSKSEVEDRFEALWPGLNEKIQEAVKVRPSHTRGSPYQFFERLSVAKEVIEEEVGHLLIRNDLSNLRWLCVSGADAWPIIQEILYKQREREPVSRLALRVELALARPKTLIKLKLDGLAGKGEGNTKDIEKYRTTQ